MSDLDDDADDRVRDALEARLIQEEVEAAAEQLHRNTRTLGELMQDWADASSEVRITVGRHSWTGDLARVSVADAAGLVVLLTTDYQVEIDLSSISSVALLGPSNRAERDLVGWAPGTLRARLRWCLNQDPSPLVGVGNADTKVQATVVAVSSSHVEARSSEGVVAFVPSFVSMSR